ncbi:4922_t:CDS:1, partial [Cetraspora pellucida]
MKILLDISEIKIEITNQESENNFLNNEVAKIIVDLLSNNNLEASKIA